MTTGLNSAPSAEDDPDWTFQGLTRQQLEKARQNCAGMAATTTVQQMLVPAAVVIQARTRGWLARRGVCSGADAGADVVQHAEPKDAGPHDHEARLLSPALRTSSGMRRSISLGPTLLDDCNDSG